MKPKSNHDFFCDSNKSGPNFVAPFNQTKLNWNFWNVYMCND